MDSILLIGNGDPKLPTLLTKMGYTIHQRADHVESADAAAEHMVDLIIIDSRASTFDPINLCKTLRATEVTKQLPIILLAKSRREPLAVENQEIPRIECIPIPYTFGMVAAKIATSVRVRKLRGADPKSKPNLGEVNSALRDLNKRFAKEMEDAKAIQQSLLSQELPCDEKIDIAVYYRPLEEVGGDWYFVEKHKNGKITAEVLDVTGHGLAAAFIGAMTKLASAATKADEAAKLLSGLNSLLSSSLPPGRFVTVGALSYDPTSGDGAYAAAGHPPAVIARADGSSEILKTAGFPVGFTDDAEYNHVDFNLKIGDSLILYSDGVTEAQDRAKSMYGMERLSDALLKVGVCNSAQDVVNLVMSDFERFLDGKRLKDDVTLMAIKRIG